MILTNEIRVSTARTHKFRELLDALRIAKKETPSPTVSIIYRQNTE